MLVELVAKDRVGDIGSAPANELGEYRLFLGRCLAAVRFELLQEFEGFDVLQTIGDRSPAPVAAE